MNAPLEYLGRPLALAGRTLVFEGSSVRVPEGAVVTVCSWCDGHRERTDAVLAAGYNATHGMCVACEIDFERGLRLFRSGAPLVV